MTSLMHAALSDVGRVREANEDSCLVIAEQGVYIVADGMGGHNCGDIASQITVSAIRSFYTDDDLTPRLKEHFQRRRKNKIKGTPSSFAEFRLGRAVESANRSVFTTAQRIPSYEDMGTTVIAAVLEKGRIFLGNVGDSRAYRIRGRRIAQLSEDHSLANEYIRMNILRKEDVRDFPYKNVIVRALGLNAQVEVDTLSRPCKPGDIYLLCSDGLTDLVEDDQIRDIVCDAEGDLDLAARNLVAVANECGGVDNITVVLIRVPEEEA